MHLSTPLSIFGVVILAILLLIEICSGAGMTVQVGATGETLFGDSQAIWSISDGSMIGIPPLACGQEIVTGISVESFLTTGGSSYAGTLDLQNSDIIRMDVEKSIVTAGPGVYSNALGFEGVDEGTPEGGCGGENFAENPAPTNETANETIPAEDSYCSIVNVQNSLMGSGIQYKSIGGIDAWGSDAPDGLEMDFAESVNGAGSINIGSLSMSGNGGGPGVLGYQNHVTTRITSLGKPATIGGSVKWTSFKSTFFVPQESESSAGG